MLWHGRRIGFEFRFGDAPGNRQRQALGKLLLVAAMKKVVEVFESAGGIGLFVDAKDEAYDFARHALLLRYGSPEEAPVEPQTLLKARRPEDEAFDVWSTMNCVGENLEKVGVSDWHLDRRGAVRSVRPLKGIDSKVSLSKGSGGWRNGWPTGDR